MTRTTRSTLAALAGFCLAVATLAAIVPTAATAQTTKSGANTPVETLSAQEKEMLALGNEFAHRITDAIEGWLTKKEVTKEKLFSYLYFPTPDTDPPKFTTDYDRLADRDFVAIQEAILARSATIIYTVTVDRNGYLPTHNQRYSQPLTGNKAADLVNNRTKRIFNDRTGYAAAQNVSPFLVQKYQRDTGETMADLSVPIVIDGKPWGAIRIGYRQLEVR